MASNKIHREIVLENPYFDIQAEMGITKHLGGLNSTEKLLKLCNIDKNSYVLEIGSGVGKSSLYLAEHIGCRVVGIDLSEEMIKKARERIKTNNLENKVKFVQADAQNLPFNDNTFDAVISESVTAFAEDKSKAINEYVRVTQSGGFVGLNESTWLKDNPPHEVAEYVFHNAGGVKPEIAEKWLKLMQESGLENITYEIHKLKALDQFIGELRISGINDVLKAWGKLFSLYLKESAYRKTINEMAKEALSTPKSLLNYFGYGIFTGQKK